MNSLYCLRQGCGNHEIFMVSVNYFPEIILRNRTLCKIRNLFIGLLIYLYICAIKCWTLPQQLWFIVSEASV